MDKKKKAVVILSGGMDSTTVLYQAISDGFDVSVISFDYGQKHKKELDYAKSICERLKVPHEIVDLQNLTKLISKSALTSDIEVPEGHYEAENMKATVVPNRNMIMASIAIGYAVNIEAEAVYLGVHAGDHFIYPDCRPQFVEALDLCAHLGNEGFSVKNFRIVAPFMFMTKADIVKVGSKLGVLYEQTHSCYQGREKACGRCGTCCERILAFTENDLVDPIEYEGGWESALQYAKSCGK